MTIKGFETTSRQFVSGLQARIQLHEIVAEHNDQDRRHHNGAQQNGLPANQAH